jgi:hypothetical protein
MTAGPWPFCSKAILVPSLDVTCAILKPPALSSLVFRHFRSVVGLI